MDVSNPIYDPSRCLVGSLGERASLRLRQDIGLLKARAQHEERIRLPSPEGEAPADDAMHLKQISDLYKALTEAPIATTTGCDLSQCKTLKKVANGCPVLGLSVNGVRVHPVGKNVTTIDKVECVSPQRQFGGGGSPGFCLDEFLRHYDYDFLYTYGTKYIYSLGTQQGFLKRIDSQMGRSCRSVKTYGGTKKTENYLFNVLDEVFDMKPGVDFEEGRWSGSIIDILDKVEVAGDASAGFPYCKEKAFAYEEMLHEGGILEELVKTLKEPDYLKARERLRKQQPELFLCELKNKRDRYERDKLKEKCRPYLAMPFHWSVLFSNLCQVFCDKLPHIGQSDKTSSAYKFSAVDGGLERVRARLAKLGKKKFDFYAYGDDVDFYMRDNKGELWRCCPDFRQMDGSIDADCVKLTCKWVYRHLSHKFGESLFWKNVTSEWIKMSTNPEFVCHGPEVYKKKKQDGMMSGTVGTTLFNTVKSVLSYGLLIAELETGEVTLKQLYSEAAMAKWFQDKCGLELKKGTWGFELVNENPSNEDSYPFWTTQKFLGVQWIYMWLEEKGKKTFQLYPHLSQEDFVSLALCPRKNVDEVGKKSRGTKAPKNPLNMRLSDQRYMFDWARGLMVTCAFSDSTQTSLLNAIVNSLSDEVILLDVQAGQGKGAPPEAPMLSEVWGKEVEYVNSFGFPSWIWCADLYGIQKFVTDRDSEWIYLFPGLNDWITKIRKSERKRNPIFMVKVDLPEKKKTFGDTPTICEVHEAKETLGPSTAMEITPQTHKKGPEDIPEKAIEVKRSPKEDVQGSVRTPRKRDFNLGDTLKNIMREQYKECNEKRALEKKYLEQSDPKAAKNIKLQKWQTFGLPADIVKQRSGFTDKQLAEACVAAGYFLQDHHKTFWVNVAPFVGGVESKNIPEQIDRAKEVATRGREVVQSKDKMAGALGAGKLLRKIDKPGEHSAPKGGVETTFKWLPTSVTFKQLFQLIRHEARNMKHQGKDVNLLWSMLNSHNYVLHYDEQTCSWEDIPETDRKCVYSVTRKSGEPYNPIVFRLNITLVTAEVDQEKGCNVYHALFRMIDYSSGKAGEDLIEPVEILETVGGNKETKRKAMIAFLVDYIFTQPKGVNFVGGSTIPDMTTFAYGDREPDTKQWFHDVVERERMSSRQPIMLEQHGDEKTPIYDLHETDLSSDESEKDSDTESDSGTELEQSSISDDEGREASAKGEKEGIEKILEILQSFDKRLKRIEGERGGRSGGKKCQDYL